MYKYFSILIITLLFFACKKEEGCMDPTALNYNSEATIDNGSCDYAPITDLNINFTQTVNGNPLILDSMMYTNQANDNYSIQTLRYLISDITLHTDNGTSTLLDEVHFIDISMASSLTLIIPEIVDKNYTAISFTMGLDSSKNITNLFLNENFFPSFSWPEPLGGGYHYMQLEGKFNTDTTFYNTHTGGTNGVDYSFTKNFPITLNIENDNSTIIINMEINNWYSKPNTISLTTDGIMSNADKQTLLQANGISDIFSVFYTYTIH
jgi:hypothetical protein